MSPFIGNNLKTILAEKKLSLEEVSRRSDIALEQLELIEKNKLVPSLHVAKKICDALEVKVDILLDGSDNNGISVLRASSVCQHSSFSSLATAHNQNMKFYSLANNPNRMMDPFYVEIGDEEITNPVSSSHEGEEFVIVVEGKAEFHYGDKVHVLERGDSVYYDSLIPHYLKAVEGPAKLLAVIYMP